MMKGMNIPESDMNTKATETKKTTHKKYPEMMERGMEKCSRTTASTQTSSNNNRNEKQFLCE